MDTRQHAIRGVDPYHWNRGHRKGFDALGDVLIPGGGLGMPHTPAAAHHSAAPSAGGPQQQQQQQQHTGKVLTGDLDSSLASLAENLTINKSASAQVK